MANGKKLGSGMLEAYPYNYYRGGSQNKMFDVVAARVLQQNAARNGNVSHTTGIRYEQPLQPVLTLDSDAMSYVPVIGDATAVAQAAGDVINGDYVSALTLPAGLLLGAGAGKAVAKGIKSIGKTVAEVVGSNPYVQLAKSRKVFNPIQKAADQAPTIEEANKILHPRLKPEDNTYFELWDNEYEQVAKNNRIGLMNIAKYPHTDQPVRITKSSTLAEARGRHADVAQDATDFESSRKTREQLATEMKKIDDAVKVSGRKTRLAQDYDLSTDSVPLGYGRYKKYVQKGLGKVAPVTDGNGIVRYIRMNNLGYKNPFSATKKAVEELNEAAGLSLPQPVRFFGRKYVPAVEYTHFNCGGLLRPYPAKKIR